MASWEGFDILEEGAADPGQGSWTRLSHNGWGALVAWLAGPGRARGIRHIPGFTTVESRGPDGRERRFAEPASAEDIRFIESGIVDYLAVHHVPVPPRGVEWEIRLPDGMTGQAFERAVNEVMLSIPDLTFQAENAAVSHYLRSIFD